MQVPEDGLQQAADCVAGGHGLVGEQLGQAECQTLGDWQPAWVVTVQAPVDGSQQAAVGGGCEHGLGLQTV